MSLHDPQAADLVELVEIGAPVTPVLDGRTKLARRRDPAGATAR
jgi:hypothetical protein